MVKGHIHTFAVFTGKGVARFKALLDERKEQRALPGKEKQLRLKL
jgi:hypothetical protein